MKYALNILIPVFFLSLNIYGQKKNVEPKYPHSGKMSHLAKKVKEAKSQLNKEFDLIENILIPNKNISISDKRLNDIKSASYFDYNKNISQQLLSKPKDAVAIQIPYEHDEGSYLTLDVIKVPDSFYDFTVTTSSGDKFNGRDIGGVHYRGIVRDKELSSHVALSIFENEIVGIISITGKGNINIGKLTQKNQHIIYNDADLKSSEYQNFCSTPSDAEQNPILKDLYSNVLKSSSANPTDKCLRVYFEVNYEMYLHFDSNTSNVVNFVTGIFNEVATLYMNESITLTISEIFVWHTYDVYIPRDLYLDPFVAERPTFDGDIAHLLIYAPESPVVLGAAKGVGGVCVTGNPDLSPHAYSMLFPDFEVFPVYSDQVLVIVHEIGHNLGSEHTHACVWNGNNTAIDGCPGITEGSCPLPPALPAGSNQGTIMSYCSGDAEGNPVGVDFNLGFGPQPGDVIRNFVSSLTCLETCEDCPYVLNIADTYNTGDNEYLEAVNGIYSIETVNTGANITYDAGKYICLSPGFIADNGSVFSTKIDGCDNDPEGLIDDESSQDKSEQSTVTEQIALKNIPNPFTGTTTIEFTLKNDSPVTLSVSDVTGRQIAVLLNNERQTEGTHQVTFDGNAYPSGMYYYTIQAGEYVGTKKMILAK